MTDRATEPILMRVSPDGDVTTVPCSYEGIKAGLDGGTMDLVVAPDLNLGAWINDNGISERLQLNVPMSIVFSQLLYGPVVISAGEPDAEGNTLPPREERQVMTVIAASHAWRMLVAQATQLGQSLAVYADPDAMPPAQVLAFNSFEDMLRFMATGEGGEVVEE